MKNKPTKRPRKLFITDEQISKISLPLVKIGINDFAKAVNEVLDLTKSKKLNGTVINKKLKLLRILIETVEEDGNRRTITNEKSEGYGIELVTKNYNGRHYQQVVFNDQGKEF